MDEDAAEASAQNADGKDEKREEKKAADHAATLHLLAFAAVALRCFEGLLLALGQLWKLWGCCSLLAATICADHRGYSVS